MGKILVMPDSLANKIAAGEVVERPASVVKELVENSIDAGSKRIEIEVKDGGLSFIKVTDDGEGMEAVDIETAFLRHATSKMLDERDLFRIRTLGFRGEALPSIAAVSKVEATSRKLEHLLAHTIKLEGNRIISTEQISHPIGSSIAVRELFYNTPARLKYLKSIQTENHHIQDMVNRLALAHPEVSFLLINEGREVLRTAGGGDLLSVIHAIYGLDAAKKMIPINGEHLDFRISGFVGKPEITRGSRSYITLLINGRYVKSYVLQKAILDGYRTLLPLNRYPIIVLHIKMDPSLVDVNVHPTKLEVRFSKEDELGKWLTTEVNRTLLYTSLIPSASKKDRVEYPQHEQQSFMFHHHARQENADRIMDAVVVKEAGVESNPLQRSIAFFDRVLGDQEVPVNVEESKYASNNALQTEQRNDKLLSLEPLAQLHGTYIVAQNVDGLYLIDQHAAQERIHYERFRKLLSVPSQSGQMLVIPYTYETTASEAELIRSSNQLFIDIGIIQESFGDRTFLVREIPDWFIQGKEVEQIDELVQMVIDGKGKFSLVDIRDRSAQLMACKASIKANQYITRAEMQSLIQQLLQTENPFTCPHGRPILIHFSLYEIEKLFKRVM